MNGIVVVSICCGGAAYKMTLFIEVVTRTAEDGTDSAEDGQHAHRKTR